jgi:methyl-accepting chemotaxis protein
MGQTASMSSSPTSKRHQRKLRNLLLDRHFQLKYSAYFLGLALFLSASLGVLLWRVSVELIAQSRESVALGEDIVQRGQALLLESKKVSDVVKMNIVDAYADDPALLEVFQGEANRHDALLENGQTQLQGNTQSLRKQSDTIAREHRFFTIVLISALVVLFVAVGLGGIVVTHRIAGPIFKMKRLLRDLGEGYLRMPTPLRKGDDLQDFFEEFARTVDRLRERKTGELDQLNRILAGLEELPGDARTAAAVTAIQGLRTLREQMSASVRTLPPSA